MSAATLSTDSVEAAAALLGDIAQHNAPLGARTTYRVGGQAALLIEADDEATLVAVAAAVRQSGVELLVVGSGSNMLVADAGFPGLAVVLGRGFQSIAIGPGATVEVGGGVLYPVLARQTAAAGLAGMEWAVGVPGSVGGAVRMNAGGHGSQTADRLVTARIFDLRQGSGRDVDAEALHPSYRHSAVGHDEVVLRARFSLEPGDRVASETLIGEIVAWRRANQPGGRNAGSVFKNPPGDSAGRLVESAGAKGLRHGSAEVSTKHANFIQSDAGGSADDVAKLIDEVRRLVAERCGVELETEVELVGFER